MDSIGREILGNKIMFDGIENISNNPIFNVHYSMGYKCDNYPEEENKINIYLEIFNPKDIFYIPLICRGMEKGTIYNRTIVYESSVGEFTKMTYTLDEQGDYMELDIMYYDKSPIDEKKDSVSWIYVESGYYRRFIGDIKKQIQ